MTPPPTASLTASCAPDALHLPIQFPKGLLGFERDTEWVLGNGPGEGLYWLEGAREGGPRFLVSDPFVFFEDYVLELSLSQASSVQAQTSASVVAIAVTTPNSNGAWTANLRGPVVLNLSEGVGAQIVLPRESKGAGLREPLEPSQSHAA